MKCVLVKEVVLLKFLKLHTHLKEKIQSKPKEGMLS